MIRLYVVAHDVMWERYMGIFNAGSLFEPSCRMLESVVSGCYSTGVTRSYTTSRSGSLYSASGVNSKFSSAINA